MSGYQNERGRELEKGDNKASPRKSDKVSKKKFDDILKLTSYMLEVPICFIYIKGVGLHGLTSSNGEERYETERYMKLMETIHKNGETNEIEDLSSHPMSKKIPMISDPPFLRSFVGSPIVSKGQALGRICAFDTIPRNFEKKDHEFLHQQTLKIIDSLKDKGEEEKKVKYEVSFPRRIIETEEKVRSRIGQDIHDGIAQSLTAAHMFFEQLKDELSAQYPNSQVKEYLNRLDGLLKKSIEEARKVSHNLTLKNLQNGLGHGLRDLFSPFDGEFHPLKVDYDCSLDGVDLTEFQEKNIYRICQEILNNGLKHSQATWMKFEIMPDGEYLCVITKDNGRGTKGDEEDAQIAESILNRVHAMEGNVRMKDEKQDGVSFKILIPVDSSFSNDDFGSMEKPGLG